LLRRYLAKERRKAAAPPASTPLAAEPNAALGGSEPQSTRAEARWSARE
jgi:hypothetical protein